MVDIKKSDLINMSIEQLRELNSMVIDVINHKREDQGRNIKLLLKVGQLVNVDHKNFRGQLVEILKINRTRAVVKRLEGNHQYNVPFSMIKIAE